MVQSIHRLPEVKTRTGLSRTTIYQWIKDGQFPRQVRLGARSVGWLESDITEWINQRMVSISRHGGNHAPAR